MKKFTALALLFFLLPNLAFAAGAYLVDDGDIVGSKTVQMENWYSHSNTGENIYVTNPAYQLLPNAEFAMQETYSDTAKTINTLWPQIKYLWHKSENVASSTTFGFNYSSSLQKNYGTYAYSATTIKTTEIFDLTFYLGWQNWRHTFRNDKSVDLLNLGLNGSLRLTNKLHFVPEIFQSNGTYKTGPNRPATQFGLRYFANDHLILDTIYGHNINGNNQNWVTLGVTLLF